ncbi:DUF6233 domain-containing protein [Streptomyces sp. NPDC058274]|uniref:DUF6233 domain-containing protein n=1 Tax=Streptomyces sp. NPDC058274 TaxID=3346416 RepID=UPI0036E009F7
MNERPPSKLELLHFARRVAVQQARDKIAQIDRWIAAEERREAERRRGAEARPAVPDWLIEQGLSGRAPVYVHVGGCWSAKKRCRGVGRDQALRALADGVDACPHCRPDTELGYLG